MYVGEQQPARQKSRYGHLVGSVEHGGTALRASQGVIGQAQAGESLRIGWLETQRLDCQKIEFISTRGFTFGPGQADADRHLHVGRAELGEHAVVTTDHHRVDDALGV